MADVYPDGIKFELLSGGKCRLSAGKVSNTGSWSLDGTAFYAKIRTDEVTGTLEQGVLVLDDFQGTGMDMVLVNSSIAGAEEYANTLRGMKPDELLSGLENAFGSTGSEPASDLAWWAGDWYGWWVVVNCEGEYADENGSWWDVCALLDVDDDGSAVITLWDETCASDEYFAKANLQITAGGDSDKGTAHSLQGEFYDYVIGENEWVMAPSTALENYFTITGHYADDTGSYDYKIHLRPWGQLWDDVEESDLPGYYTDWYLPLLEQGVTEAPMVVGPES